MAVRPAYKQTEVGDIPMDWNVKSLEQVTSHIGDGLHGTPIYSLNGGHFFINGNNLSNGRIVTTDETKAVEYSEFIKHRKPLNSRSILLSINGTIGNLALYSDEPILLGKSAAYLNIKNGVCKEFVYQSLQTSTVRRQFFDGLTGSTIGNLGLATIRGVQLSFPATETEQHSIAAVLSDVDALLDGLTRLISKKRDLKQATMQQLLTGQARLPGFFGEWEVKRLRDHLTFLKNGVNSRAELISEGRVKYLHYGDIHGAAGLLLNPETTSMPHLSVAKAKQLERLSDGDLVFADASEDLDGVGKSVELQGVGNVEVVSGLHTIAVRFDKQVLADGFKAYLQFIPAFCQHLRRHAAGTKVYATNKAHIASAEIKLPDVEEQTAIATILADMDAELAALEARLTKIRALKQAMMQELLTGKTRLFTPEAAHA